MLTTETEEKEIVNTFFERFKQADLEAEAVWPPAGLEAVSLEQSFLTVEKGITKDKRSRQRDTCVLTLHLWRMWSWLTTEPCPEQG